MTRLDIQSYAARVADRLWARHAKQIQAMSVSEVESFAREALDVIAPTEDELRQATQRLLDLRSDYARPPDAPPRTADPGDRYFS